jgi:uncharacterized ferritin-like protein (DUF455 family)
VYEVVRSKLDSLPAIKKVSLVSFLKNMSVQKFEKPQRRGRSEKPSYSQSKSVTSKLLAKFEGIFHLIFVVQHLTLNPVIPST